MRGRKKFTPHRLRIGVCDSTIHDTSFHPTTSSKSKGRPFRFDWHGVGVKVCVCLRVFFLGMSSLGRNFVSSATLLFTAQIKVLLIDNPRILCLLLEKKQLKIVTQLPCVSNDLINILHRRWYKVLSWRKRRSTSCQNFYIIPFLPVWFLMAFFFPASFIQMPFNSSLFCFCFSIWKLVTFSYTNGFQTQAKTSWN